MGDPDTSVELSICSECWIWLGLETQPIRALVGFLVLHHLHPNWSSDELSFGEQMQASGWIKKRNRISNPALASRPSVRRPKTWPERAV
ncbi:hypothetical protein BJX99DRAFT_204382 [Aspergillus californicus]